MKLNNNSIVLNGIISIIQIVVGGANLIFWGIGGIGAFVDEDIEFGFGDLIFALILSALAGWMLYCGIKRFTMGKKVKNYVNVVGNVAMISITDIAGSVRVAESQVEHDFQWLIKKNFLVDAYIDHDDKAIVFREAYSKIVEQREREEQAKKQIVYVSVMCECCHGTTEIEKGKVGKCDYCGAPISLKP